MNGQVVDPTTLYLDLWSWRHVVISVSYSPYVVPLHDELHACKVMNMSYYSFEHNIKNSKDKNATMTINSTLTKMIS